LSSHQRQSSVLLQRQMNNHKETELGQAAGHWQQQSNMTIKAGRSDMSQQPIVGAVGALLMSALQKATELIKLDDET
jgi:hypothetical protein